MRIFLFCMPHYSSQDLEMQLNVGNGDSQLKLNAFDDLPFVVPGVQISRLQPQMASMSRLIFIKMLQELLFFTTQRGK